MGRVQKGGYKGGTKKRGYKKGGVQKKGGYKKKGVQKKGVQKKGGTKKRGVQKKGGTKKRGVQKKGGYKRGVQKRGVQKSTKICLHSNARQRDSSRCNLAWIHRETRDLFQFLYKIIKTICRIMNI